PSFIALRTIIDWPAPRLQNTGKIHGSPLGADEVARTKRLLGFDPEESFVVEDEVLHHTRQALDRGKRLRTAWQEAYEAWAAANPERRHPRDRRLAREPPPGAAA